MKDNKNKIVFVVDDDQAVRDSLKFALELDGLTVLACASGDELLRHPELKNARCLLIDYKMPLMDGFEVLHHLAAQGVRVPVILITSFVNSAISRRAKMAGVRRILEKPLLDSTLLDSIQDILAD